VTHLSSPSPSPSPLRRIVLGAAAALGAHTRSATPDVPAPALTAPALDAVDGGELTARLTRLHDDHVERVNAAVGEGREDLVQELSDSYVEQAMALMTTAGLPPARAAQQLAA
jgi:hypothetical protein